MDINLELYKVFYYVATTLSFSEASRQLFISQSAVSLEKRPCFVRSTKILTEGEQNARPSKAGPYSVCAQYQTGHPDSGGRASSPACKAGPFHAKRRRGCPFRRRKSYRSAADRCQRYSVPLFSHPLSPPFPQGSSGGTDQDHQQYLHRMCGASGKRPG